MELYWLLRLPHLEALFNIITVFGTLVGSALAFFGFLEYNSRSYRCSDESKSKVWKILNYGRILIACALICGLIICFIPSKTDLDIMLMWDAIKSDSVQEVIEILKEKIK